MSSSKKMIGSGLASFGLTTAHRLLSRPNVQSAARGMVRKVVTGSREKPYRSIPAVEKTVDFVVAEFEKRELKPKCLGIDGIAGGGKSTLGRSLSTRLGLGWRTLYAREVKQRLHLREGQIYENIRLFRTQDIDKFDALLYIDIPIETARSRVIERDRNGTLADVLDFEKLKRIGDLVFDISSGTEIRIPDSYIRMKIRPPEGYRVRETLRAMLEEKGLTDADLSIEEMLFLYSFGEAKEGIRPYLKLGVYSHDVFTGILTGLLVALDQLS